VINYVKGDILQSTDDAVVNPVNCVGVMGAGLAKQFRDKYPDMFADYKLACAKKEIKIGVMWIYYSGPDSQIIINFPTKKHWNDPSKLSYIHDGLISLKRTISYYHLKSISIPKIGAGLGGLDWVEVKAEIEKILGDYIDYCEVNIYE
jgi:O-acetyl-ADP-ribose deacetylase (regulator of RNase III)